MSRIQPFRTVPIAALALLAALACGEAAPEAGIGQGTVVSVSERQVVLDHGEIPGLMGAMTMGFDVDDPAVLEGIVAGQEVEFTAEHVEGRYRVTAIRVREP